MDTRPADLLTAWWESGDVDCARVAADALLESGTLPDRLGELSAAELAGVLQRFRSMVLAVPALAAVANKVVEGATEGVRALARALASVVPDADRNFPP